MTKSPSSDTVFLAAVVLGAALLVARRTEKLHERMDKLEKAVDKLEKAVDEVKLGVTYLKCMTPHAVDFWDLGTSR